MTTQQFIASLNARASKLWINESNLDCEVVAVCVYVSQDGKYAQAWFSHWNKNEAVPSYYDKFIADGNSIDNALGDLDAYLMMHESEAKALVEEGDRIIDKIGFGD